MRVNNSQSDVASLTFSYTTGHQRNIHARATAVKAARVDRQPVRINSKAKGLLFNYLPANTVFKSKITC